jgi:hypothetical protein
MKYFAFLILTFAFVGCTLQRSTNNHRPQARIYLLMGQSNMAGRGVITDEYKNLQNSRVLMLNDKNTWVLAKHPVHFDKPKAAGVGPGLTFGIKLAETYPKDTIYLVPCAVGGTSIAKWEPGAFDKATNTHPYDDALLRIKEAMKKGKIEGAIWLQGESDSNPKAAAIYLAKLALLIERIREVTQNPKLPFIVGELGRYRENYKLINDQLHQLPAKVAFTGFVTSEGLVHKGDTTHFDSPSATLYGARFATGMIKLLEK